MIFWVEENIKITYDNLIEDLIDGKSSFDLVGYKYFFNLLVLFKSDCNFKNLKAFQSYLLANSSDKFFLIETSGTTSTPKKVKVSLKKCIRQVKIYNDDNSRVWANCYPIRSYACTQVFFQAFFNSEPIVYCFTNDFEKVNQILINEKVTNLTCTPTFLNMLIISSDIQNEHVNIVTTGGEKITDKTLNAFKSKFIKAKYINIYASTESGSLLYSNSNEFKIPLKYKNLIKIKNNELLIHKSLINKSTKNNIIGDWFYSGDEVKMIAEDSFKFSTRKSSYINTGGYRVNPIEIEEAILKIATIDDVRVFGKENSILGTIICAEVISASLNARDIKFYLKDVLEDYKIPQIFKMVDKLSLTKTGKKSRK